MTTKRGTTAWTTEGGREQYAIGGLIVYITPTEAEAWNRGGFDGDERCIRCHIPTHEPDRYSHRRDEMIAGAATDWYGTIGEAIDAGLLPADYYDTHMAGETAERIDR